MKLPISYGGDRYSSLVNADLNGNKNFINSHLNFHKPWHSCANFSQHQRRKV